MIRRIVGRILSKGAQLGRDRAANVVVFFALSLFPILGIVGFALDYGAAQNFKAELAAAADSAALAAITKAQTEPSATTVVADATTAATSAFASNLGARYSMLSQPLSIHVAKSGRTFNATIGYQAARPTIFGNVLNISTMNIAGSAQASVTLPSYLDFNLLLDVSGSMGIASTSSGPQSEQARLAAINPDNLSNYPNGCAFACHFAVPMCPGPNNTTVACQGFNLSRTNGTGTRVANDYCPTPGLSTCIQLRIDAVAYAVQQLLAYAPTKQTLPSQYRVGLFPFIVHMQTLLSLTSNLATVATSAASLPDLLDTGSGTNVAGQLGSGGTHLDNALTEMNAAIPTVGDGSSASSPLPFVFLVTDGAQDNQYYLAGSGWTGSNHATTINTANCTLLKNRGITLAVLYVAYDQIQNVNTSFAGDEDDYANWNIPNIPPALTSCASPGFFFTADTPANITAAMQAMFATAVQAARLTH